MYLKRIFSGVLAALLLLSLCACGAGGEKDKETSAQPSSSESLPDTQTSDAGEDASEGRTAISDRLPDNLDFNDAAITVLYRGAGDGQGKIEIYDVVGTDNSGDYVSDAVWQRNRSVEDRLHVRFDYIATNAGNVNSTASFIKQTVMANSDEFDYINSTGNTTIKYNINSYLRDLAELPYVDYDQPWWWNFAIDSVSLDGKTINYIFGDMLIYCYIQTGVFYYNKSICQDLWGDADMMYSYVMDGTWTMDKLIELTAGAYQDANGSGAEDDGDIFGCIRASTVGEQPPHFFVGFDIEMYQRDEEGNFVISFDEDRSVKEIEKMYKLWSETPGILRSTVGIDDSVQSFAQDKALFYPGRFSSVMTDYMRNMESPYGILPYPKLDEEQAGYVSMIHDSSSNICIPKTVSDVKVEAVAAALEALCAESYRSVMPEFLNTALKFKYSQDELSGKVIDLVLDGVAKNTLYEYRDYTADIFITCLINPSNGSGNFASSYAKVRPAAQKTWDKAVAGLQQ